MLRLIFLFQSVVYFILMPILHSLMDDFYLPPIEYSFLAIAALLIGYFLSYRIETKNNEFYNIASYNEGQFFLPRQAIVIGFAALALLYAYVSWTNGLLNRRQGSEVMADIYGNLPIYELLVLRVYEISMIPIAVIYFFSKSRIDTKIFVFLIIIFSLPFTGIEDSRGRLIVMAIFVLSFVKIDDFIRFFYRNLKIYIFLLGAFFAFFYTSLQRLSNYARVEDFLFYEIVRRLDGLNLLTELQAFGFIRFLGTFDFQMFNPLISRIPFLEAGRIAKIEGITSTKQYYLKSLLNSGRIDESNSLITDPVYLFGGIGVFILFLILGYAISKFDYFVKKDRIFHSRIGLSLALSFVTSFAIIESDLFGAITTFFQNFVIIYAMNLIILHKPIQLDQFMHGESQLAVHDQDQKLL
jgi:hypothetical protein